LIWPSKVRVEARDIDGLPDLIEDNVSSKQGRDWRLALRRYGADAARPPWWAHSQAETPTVA
jgi:hypothetical protein